MKLKKCPFCGSKRIEVMGNEYSDESKRERVAYYVECRNCGNRTGWQYSESLVIDKWNRRYDDTTYRHKK